MRYEEAFEAKKAGIMGMDINAVIAPDMSPKKYLRRGIRLINWTRADIAVLIQMGLDEGIIDETYLRLLAFKKTQCDWESLRGVPKESLATWLAISPRGYEIRDILLHKYRYAFRKEALLLKVVRNISRGESIDDMVMDLPTAVTLGRNNSKLLQKVGFDEALLDEAEDLSRQLDDIPGIADADRGTMNETKVLRDRAFSFAKQKMDEILACGKSAFWKDDTRLRGYRI